MLVVIFITSSGDIMLYITAAEKPPIIICRHLDDYADGDRHTADAVSLRHHGLGPITAIHFFLDRLTMIGH